MRERREERSEKEERERVKEIVFLSPEKKGTVITKVVCGQMFRKGKNAKTVRTSVRPYKEKAMERERINKS